MIVNESTEERRMRWRKTDAAGYDRARKEPVLRCSICTGEQVAGFLDLQDRHFEEVMLIRDADDLRRFCRQYGVSEPIRKIY